MSDAQQVAARERQEVASKDEKTVFGRVYSPSTDIFETNDALMVIMEIPGVGREHIRAQAADGVLTLALPKMREAQTRRIPIRLAS